MIYLPHTQDCLCLEGNEYIQDGNGRGLVSLDLFNKQRQRGIIKVHGTGGNGRTVLIEYESLPLPYKKLVQEKLCGGIDVYEYAALQPIRSLIQPDIKAIEFFDRYITPSGKPLNDRLRIEYSRAASIMRMIDKVYEDKRWLKRELKVKLTKFLELVGTMKETKDAGLPSSDRKLREKYAAWKEKGYEGLISGKVGNSNTKKVTDNLTDLILSLYTQGNKPYASDVLDIYNAFMNYEYDLVNIESGEVFEPTNYMVNGQVVNISSATIWKILHDNAAIVDKMRLSRLEYNGRHRPFNSRTAPIFSFSKITMDDRSIPFKMEDGKRAWTYIIADVASGCIVGRSYSRSSEDGSGKNRKLFMEAMMDMFRRMVNNNWGMPAEIEVEHHISNTFTGKTDENGVFVPDLLTDKYLFPFVTFCNPQNPQQKRAEHIIRQIKYQLEKEAEGFQGRPFARTDANRLNQDKPGKRYFFDELVAFIESLINKWNNSPHPNQTRYPGLTRWQVLEQHQNPNLVTPYLPLVCKHIGIKDTVNVRRTQVNVFNASYVVPADNILNNHIVTAYGLPDNEGQIAQVYLYENDSYVCTAHKKGAYNEAKVERTAEDERILLQQNKHTAQFDAKVKDRTAALKKIAVVKQSHIDQSVIPQVVNADYSDARDPLSELIEEDGSSDMIDWEQKAINDL